MLAKIINSGSKNPKFLTSSHLLKSPFSIDIINNTSLYLQNRRKDYNSPEITIEDFSKDPFTQFKTWLTLSFETEIGIEPQSMALSTCCPKTLQPSSRYVLLKEVQNEKFKFFTNLNSRKSQELSLNNKVSGLFYWPLQNRTVRIEGVAERLGVEEEREYFESRPALSRISGIVSPQSKEISEAELEILKTKFLEMKEGYKKGENDLGKPEYWGGFAINPVRFEFWQGNRSRFHDRFAYLRTGNGEWEIKRLAP